MTTTGGDDNNGWNWTGILVWAMIFYITWVLWRWLYWVFTGLVA